MAASIRFGKCADDSSWQRDFVEFASKIPAALPRVIRRSLRTRSLLFVGHGLFEPDVQAFARYARN